uniref:Uncharacterized protein n=1 Tax=Culex quinquefasciatus TaxID=7176 RepID=A0A1S4JK84_CULQU
MIRELLDFLLLLKNIFIALSLFIRKGLEARRKASLESDPSSPEPDDIFENLLDPFTRERYKFKNVPRHLEARFTRFIRLGAQLQYISAKTGVPRGEIVHAGASQFQDRSSTVQEMHAAHVIRVGNINENIGEYYESFIRNFVGHTQIVHRLANIGVGRDFDTIQSKYLDKLAVIDFTTPLNKTEARLIEEIRDAFSQAITDCLVNRTYPELMYQKLMIAREKIKAFTPREVFQKATKGVNYLRKKCKS